MPPKTRASEAEWEGRKETIRKLWLDKDHTLQAVINEMTTLGFVATKSQYEAKFKEWGFTKNVPVITWKHVGYKIEKRKREDKESVVSINGVQISAKRLKKEMSRHFYSLTERVEIERNNAPSPPGPLTVVATPPGIQEILSQIRWPTNLPWFSFIKFLDSRLKRLPRMHLNPRTMHNGLPGTQKENRANHVPGGQASRTTIASDQQLVLDTIKEYVPSDLNYALLPFSSYVEWPAQISPSTSLESTSSSHWGLKALIYLASNKLLGSYDTELIWQMIQKAGIGNLAIFSNSSYLTDTSLAAALECLFEAGIQKAHTNLVSWLLDAGMDPNTMIKLSPMDTEVHLPLIGAISNSPMIVHLLLSRGASPTLFCCEYHDCPTAFLFWDPDSDTEEENLDAFLDALLQMTKTSDNHTQSEPLDHSECGEEVDISLSHSDQPRDEVAQKMEQLVILFDDYVASTSHSSTSLTTQENLTRAIEQDRHRMIRLLHKRGLEMNHCDENGRFPLEVAAASSDEHAGIEEEEQYLERIKLLLELGASPDYDPWSQSHADCSPVLQAVIHTCETLLGKLSQTIALLIKHGAHVQGTPGCYEFGHFTLVDCALSRKKEWLPQSLTDVLITLNHAGLPLPQSSMLSILELAYESDFYDWQDELGDEYAKLLKVKPSDFFDLSLRSKYGRTALDLAVLMDEHELQVHLIDHGAEHTRAFVYQFCCTGTFYDTQDVEEMISNLPVARTIKQSRDMLFYQLIGILRCKQPVHERWEPFTNLLSEYCKIPRSLKRDAYVIDKACASDNARLITTTLEMLPNVYSCTALETLIRPTALDVDDQWNFIQELLRRRAGVSLNYEMETRLFMQVVRNTLKVAGDARVLNWFQKHDRTALEHANMHPSTFAIQIFHRKAPKNQWCDLNVTQWLNYGLKASSYLGLLVAYSGQVDKMNALLRQGFQPNRRICWSLTALQFAVLRADEPMTLCLLEAQCDVNARPPWRDIPISISDKIPWEVESVLASHKQQTHRRHALQLAVEKGDLSITKLLLKYGADVNGPAARIAGATALQLACIKGYIEIVRLLISEGADVNAPGAKYYGRTALQGAAENGRLDIVCLLLEHDCRIDGRFRPHYIRAVGFARAQGHHVLSKMLQDSGKWNPEDESLLVEMDLRDKNPSSRNHKVQLSEDEEISEVDPEDFASDPGDDDAFPYETDESDSDDYQSISEDYQSSPEDCQSRPADSVSTIEDVDATPSAIGVNEEGTLGPMYPHQLIVTIEQDCSDGNEFFDVLDQLIMPVEQEQPLEPEHNERNVLIPDFDQSMVMEGMECNMVDSIIPGIGLPIVLEETGCAGWGEPSHGVSLAMEAGEMDCSELNEIVHGSDVSVVPEEMDWSGVDEFIQYDTDDDGELFWRSYPL